MKLKDYFSSQRHGAQSLMAESLGVARAYMGQMVHGAKPVSPALAIKIERFTQAQVTRADLVDNWQAIWPEFDPAHSPYAPLAKDASVGQQIARASALTGLSVVTTSLAAAYGGWHTQYMAKPVAMKYAGGALRVSTQEYAHGAVN